MIGSTIFEPACPLLLRLAGGGALSSPGGSGDGSRLRSSDAFDDAGETGLVGENGSRISSGRILGGAISRIEFAKLRFDVR